MMRLSIAFVLMTFAAAGCFGQAQAAAAKARSYEVMLAELKGGNTGIDYTALRMAYAASKDAGPDGSDHEARRVMNAALQEKRYSDAIRLAEDILKTTYLSPDAHAAESLAYGALGDAQKAAFHRSVYLGLINSILAGADGKTAGTAYRVVTIEEEYAVMRALGYTVWGQQQGMQSGHMVEVLSATDEKTKMAVKVYFNIDTVWALETKRRAAKPPD